MDAKSKANFINAVAGGQKTPCPACNSINEKDALFCFSCGQNLTLWDSSIAKCEENETVFCSECKTINEGSSLFCASCGAKLVKKEKTPAFSPVKRTRENNNSVKLEDNLMEKTVKTFEEQAFRVAMPIEDEETEEVSVFAQGLPAWDIVPPHVMVRRKRKR